MNRSPNWLLGILLASLLYSCSSSETLTKAGSDASQIYPIWYEPAGIAQDSISVRVYATAIGTDSSDVISRATDQALANLEVYLGGLAEQIRDEMEQNEHPEARNTKSILALRVVNSDWKSRLNPIHTESSLSGKVYRAFAAISISKEIVEADWSSALQYEEDFLSGFSKTETYQQFFRSN